MLKAMLIALVLTLSIKAANGIEAEVQPNGAVFIKLSPAEVAQCAAEGGCAVISKRALQQYGESLRCI